MAEASAPTFDPAVAPLPVILGPTASGKSALAVVLAEKFGGEILACDSTQVYRGFDIGTAKPSQGELARATHHLLDLLGPEQLFTAGEYRKYAIDALDVVRRRGHVPILTAGTGLYLRALLEGLADVPLRSEELRQRLMRRAGKNRPGYLHRVLARMDAQAAARIAPQDTPKLVRAIEVCVLAGQPITEVFRKGRQQLEGFRPIKVGLNPPRTSLYERIDRRVLEMIDRGWLDEVKRLMNAGMPRDAKPFSFIGYAELREHLEGKRSLDSAVAAIQQATRRYAKRQVTWFRKEQDVRWFEGFGDDPEITKAILDYVREQMPPQAA
jgi:tRNA dimethylallyltransferase